MSRSRRRADLGARAGGLAVVLIALLVAAGVAIADHGAAPGVGRLGPGTTAVVFGGLVLVVGLLVVVVVAMLTRPSGPHDEADDPEADR